VNTPTGKPLQFGRYFKMSRKKFDIDTLIGTKVNKLTVIKFDKSVKKNDGNRYNHFVFCECECGNIKSINIYQLSKNRKRTTQSCGCLPIRKKLSLNREYFIWSAMKDRCFNTNNKAYKNYGGRGITVSENWINNYPQFISDMGFRPSKKHTLERIDNNQSYCKENCRWATRQEQMSNTRRNVYITHDGITLTQAQWARKLGIDARTISSRLIDSKMSIEDALSKNSHQPYNRTKKGLKKI